MNHGRSIHPVKVAGVVCPQCLCIFASHSACSYHMEQKGHFRFAHPFPGDTPNNGYSLVMPVTFWTKFSGYCLSIPWHGRCVDCSGRCLGPYDDQLNSRMLLQPLTERIPSHVSRGHLVAVHSSMTLVDAICFMMKEFSCGVCHRLFDHHPSEEEHHCEGHVQKYAVSRFQEFLLRSALKPLAADSSSSGGGGENQESSQVSVARSLVDSSVNEAEAVTQPSSRKRAHSECEDGEADQLSSKAFCAAGDANECSDPINKDDESLACSASSNQTQTVSKSTDGATARGLDDDVPDAAATVACSRGTSPEIGVHRGGGLNLTSAAGADVGRTAQDNYSIAAATDMLVESERNTSRQTEDVDGPVAGDVCSAQRCESRTDVSDSQLLSANNGEHDVDPVLNGFDQLIFLDIDNWSKFFYRMPGSLPEKTFVWGFYGGTTTWKEPTDSSVYMDAKKRGIVYINSRCSTRKDSADFAICLQVGRMNERLSNHVTFTILSGDGGFREVEVQCAKLSRRTIIMNPHRMSDSHLYVLIRSVVDK